MLATVGYAIDYKRDGTVEGGEADEPPIADSTAKSERGFSTHPTQA